MRKVRGRIEAFFETGTEGVIWSVVDPRLPGYDGLWTLHDSDQLTILGRQKETLWDGTIQLEYERNWEPYPYNPNQGQQAVAGFWVHGLQVDVDPDDWVMMFCERFRAILTLGPEQETPVPHPFNGPSVDMAERLHAVGDYEQLYRYALYPWLHFMSGGEYFSFATDMGFTLDETLLLLGAPENPGWRLRPFDWPIDWDVFTRVALLWGVYGSLSWKFHDKEDAAVWLRDTSRKMRLLSGIEGIAEVRNELMASEAD